jgi:hypothetical protein
VVQRLSAPNAISAIKLSKEVGVSQSALSRWLELARTVVPITKELHFSHPAAHGARARRRNGVSGDGDGSGRHERDKDAFMIRGYPVAPRAIYVVQRQLVTSLVASQIKNRGFPPQCVVTA